MRKKLAIEFTLGLMKTSEAVYLGTVNEQGFPQIRAMVNLCNPGKYPKLKDFFQDQCEKFHSYFATLSTSEKVEHIKHSPRVALYYSYPELFHGVMLSGQMEVVKDKKLKELLWHDVWKVYFPKGATDSKYLVYHFIPESAKGWKESTKFQFSIRKES